MEKTIATVFKILAGSMLLMFLLDTTLLMVEIVSIHSRVSNITSIIQTEVARNNCMPTIMAQGFLDYLYDIADNSTIAQRSDVTTNFSANNTINGISYQAISPENAGEYGEFVTLAIGFRIHPAFVYYNPNRNSSNQSWLNRGNALSYQLSYVYSVPCLRYLK